MEMQGYTEKLRAAMRRAEKEFPFDASGAAHDVLVEASRDSDLSVDDFAKLANTYYDRKMRG